MEVATSKIKKGYKLTDIGVIPEDWDVKTCGELGSFYKGKGISSHNLVAEGVPCIMYGDIYVKFQTKFTHADFRISQETASKSSRAKKGDLFFTGSGETAEDIGKCVAYLGEDDLYIGGDIIAMSPYPDTDSTFLAYAQNTPLASMQKANLAQGHTVVHIYANHIKSLKVAVPQVEGEQNQIATALSDTDELIQSLDALIEKKKNIKTATMQQLLSGKIRLAGFSDEWVTTPLGDAVDFFHGRGLPKADLSDDGLKKCIHYGQLFTEYNEQVREVRSRTNNTDNIFVSKSNDVLIPTSDVTPRGLATASCIKENGVILGGGILVLRPKTDIDGSFVSYFITNNKNVVLKLVKGSTVFHLYASDLSKLELRMPLSVKEQAAIVVVLEDMKSEINSLEKRRDKLISLKQGMMHELLTGNTRLV